MTAREDLARTWFGTPRFRWWMVPLVLLEIPFYAAMLVCLVAFGIAGAALFPFEGLNRRLGEVVGGTAS